MAQNKRLSTAPQKCPVSRQLLLGFIYHLGELVVCHSLRNRRGWSIGLYHWSKNMHAFKNSINICCNTDFSGSVKPNIDLKDLNSAGENSINYGENNCQEMNNPYGHQWGASKFILQNYTHVLAALDIKMVRRLSLCFN